MTDLPPGYTISIKLSDGWRVYRMDDVVMTGAGPYGSRDAAVQAAWIFYGREGRNE